MSTNPEEFRLFHQLLTAGAPDYQPFYFVLRPGGKEPLGERGPWKEANVSFDEACDWMKAGYNIAIAGTDRDPLVIIDIDKEGVVNDVKETLTVRSRKRTGRHHFYFTNDPRCKVNVPTAENVGEIRSSWQYVVCCGSFVRTDPAKLEVQPPEDQLPSLGSYTIEKDATIATITFDELPLIFRQTIVDQAATQQPKREPKKWDKEGPQSKLWSLSLKDVIGEYPEGRNFPSPFHGSEGGINTTVSNGLLHCWRHKVSLTPLQALVVKAGIMDCMTAGDGHKGSSVGPSTVDFKNKEFVVKLWDWAKKNGILPQDDLHPFGDSQPQKKHGGKGEKKQTCHRKDYPDMADDVWKQSFADADPDNITVLARPYYYFKNGSVAMEILPTDGVPRFALFDIKSGAISVLSYVTGDGDEIVLPTWDASLGVKFGIALPSESLDYGSVSALYQEMLAYILRYYDPVDDEGLRCVKLDILYVLMTGFQDQNITYWPIINLRGQSETGKGRLAFLLYLLSCRGMWEAKPKVGTLHRSVNDWQPTLCLDEMDLKDSSESDDIVQFLNCRATGALYRRYSTVSGRVEISKVTGPTIVCTRSPFVDDGIESRCIVQPGKSGRKMGRDANGTKRAPYLVPPEAFDEALAIRNKLLTFWLTKKGQYVIDYWGPKDSPLTHRLQSAVLEIADMARLVGLENEVNQIVEALSREMSLHRSEKPEGKLVRALYLMWTDAKRGGPVKSASKRFLADDGFYNIQIVDGSGKTESQHLATAKDWAEVAWHECELTGMTKGQLDPAKPMSTTTIGRKYAKQLYIQTGAGGREGRCLCIKDRDLEENCRKFIPDYEKGAVLRTVGTDTTTDKEHTAAPTVEQFDVPKMHQGGEGGGGTDGTVGTDAIVSGGHSEEAPKKGGQTGFSSSSSKNPLDLEKPLRTTCPRDTISSVPCVPSVPEHSPAVPEKEAKKVASSVPTVPDPKKRSALTDEEKGGMEEEDKALRTELARISEKYVEGEILDYMITELLKGKVTGDKVSPFILKQIAQVQFRERDNGADVVKGIVDSGYSELDAVAERIHKLKKRKASMPKEAPP